MNRSNSNQQGIYYLSDTITHVDSAIVEDVITISESEGYVLISFNVGDENTMIYTQELRLNVGNNTIIINEEGMPLTLYDLRKGMIIDADFSSAMTRSIPPQSYAYRIIVLVEENSVNITMDRVVSVDTENGFLFTGNPYDIYDQKIFIITNDTAIQDRNNNTIPVEAIQPGQLVQVEHAIFETLSIPPQSPAFRVQVLR